MEHALLSNSDGVLHARVVVQSIDSSERPPEGSDIDAYNPDDFGIELWIDGRDGIVRVEERLPVPDGELHIAHAIVRDDGTFRVAADGQSRDVDSLRCRGATSVALAQLMLCRNYLEKSSTSVREASYDGQPVIVLVTAGDLPSHDWNSSFEHRLYVDASSLMPVAGDDRQTVPVGDQKRIDYRVRYRYDTEFVERSLLSSEFFEPSSIGYVERDPAANLRADADGMPVYWLGREFDPGTGAAPLVLFAGGIHPGTYPPGYRALLSYEQAGGKRGRPMISMQEFPPEAWRARPLDTEDAGTIREEIALPAGRAVLVRGQDGYEAYRAYVYFEETVVFVMDHGEPTDYTNRATFVAIINGLRPYP